MPAATESRRRSPPTTTRASGANCCAGCCLSAATTMTSSVGAAACARSSACARSGRPHTSVQSLGKPIRDEVPAATRTIAKSTQVSEVDGADGLAQCLHGCELHGCQGYGRAWDERSGEAELGRLAEARLELADAAQLARKANLTDRNQVHRQRPVAHTGHNRQRRREISAGFLDSQPANHVEIDILIVEWKTGATCEDRCEQVQTVGVEAGGRPARNSQC